MRKGLCMTAHWCPLATRCSASILPNMQGHHVTVYGQTEVTRDLYAAREAGEWQD